MKVLFCTDEVSHVTTGSGGFARLLSEMHHEGMELDILSEEALLHSRGEHSNGISRLPLIGYLQRSNRLWKAIQERITHKRYDVLFFNDIWMGYTGRRFLMKERPEAVVAFMHDDNTLDWSNTKPFTGRWLSFKARAYMERKVIPHLDLVLTNSEYLLGLLQSNDPGIPAARLYYSAVNYQAIDFRPRIINGENTIHVLFIKTDFTRGGLKELIEALKSLTQYRFSLTVVGPSISDLKEKLGPLLQNTKQLVFDLKGHIAEPSVIRELYAQHDLLCVPAKNEALGLVNAEALASGIPVVSSNVGGIPEVLDYGAGGFIAEDATISELARAIETCITQPEETKRRSLHGRKFVLDRFNVHSMHAHLMDLLSKAMHTRKKDHLR